MLYPEILEWKPSSMMHRPEMSARRKPTFMLFALDSWGFCGEVSFPEFGGDFRGAFNFSELFVKLLSFNLTGNPDPR